MQLIAFPDTFTQLADVELIDGYFASQFSCDSDTAHQHLWFMILVALSCYQRQGHTCLKLDLLADTCLFADRESELEGWRFPARDVLNDAVEHAVNQCRFNEALRVEAGRLYTLRYWQFEHDIAAVLSKRITRVTLEQEHYDRLQSVWPVLFPEIQAQQQDWQQIATAAALQQRFTIINGGPGTGKTYTVTRLLLALQCMNSHALKIQLAAPTGKAAQRMNESVTGALNQLQGRLSADLISSVSTDAVTLHRLLGISRYGVHTRHHEESPLPCDVLIIDEASMVDTALMARIVRALPAHASLVLVGDADQLPAVESGNVLEALIHGTQNNGISPALSTHLNHLNPALPALAVSDQARDYVQTLKVSQRFSGDLSAVAGGIRQGSADEAMAAISRLNPLPDNIMTVPDGVSMVSPDNFESKLSVMAKQCFSAIAQSSSVSQALEAMQACRWLTSTRRGPLGVEQLNLRIEEALGVSTANTGSRHYKGRPVMVTQNNYAQKLFNGDVGIIWPDDNHQLKAWFDTETGLRAVSLSRLPAVETVYAMTVHKSQGSEFARVLMILAPPLSSQMAALNTRELLYTGLTRAKQACTLVCTQSQFTQVVKTRVQRHSGLASLMADAAAK
ncbi:exodeoxyribonuclease V subunit alpha [Salinimonas sp. HHU 13199]|uniref:RecBCD enzyme subunit RecD n=1 Tax=Salinimonas profundi TaxID=2729140 RepID=A0ABR8LG05_9ALTE|nr:exodeoxyribonuclease V subunit alpha [Salinimonas profundi]MBD3584235.1 exodeoxyribonuclease V subunit alpha [Salinimonas profundi]